MKRGFTLIELLVVISVISLLSSIIFGGVAVSRSKARDNHRAQEVHQIDTAIQLYASTHGKVPTLLGACDQTHFVNDFDLPMNCVAISNAHPDSGQGKAWKQLIETELRPYLPATPIDPCPTCANMSGYTTELGTNAGYVYIAPAALYYYCNYTSMFGGEDGIGSPFCTSQSINEYTYQVFAPLENKVVPFGSSSAHSNAENCFLISFGHGSSPSSETRGIWAWNPLKINIAHAALLPILDTLGTGC